jgi:hypothetical protein
MSNVFIAVSIVFIIFILIAYLLNVVRLSVPLIIIYLIYCFGFIIDNELKDITEFRMTSQNQVNELEEENKTANNNNNNNSQNFYDTISIYLETNKNSQQKKISVSSPKPIISYNPKPIIIDSNIISNNENAAKIEIKRKNIETYDSLSNSEDTIQNTLELNEIMICRGIYKRNPIKPGSSFINNVDSLFCYTKITNSGSKQEIKHIWYFDDKEISSVTYNIKTSYNYRSWSRKTIYPRQIGKWRVDVIDSYGNILGRRNFNIKSINSSY